MSGGMVRSLQFMLEGIQNAYLWSNRASTCSTVMAVPQILRITALFPTLAVRSRLKRVFLRDLFFTRRSAALAMLGLAGGLPYVVATVAVQGLATSARMSEAAIGAFSLLLLPYSLKVLWAPLVDALMPPRLRGMGRRRGWIALAQLVIVASLVAMAAALFIIGTPGPSNADGSAPSASGASPGPTTLFIVIFAIAFIMTLASATQDVSSDAYRIDVSPPETRAAAASVFVMGYRAALAVIGAGSLILSGRLAHHFGDTVGWTLTFVILALVMLAFAAATSVAPEPPDDAPERLPVAERLLRAVIEPFRDMHARLGWRLPALLLFVFIFKLPDNLAIPMTLPFLHTHLHYELETIGWVRQAVGVGVTIGGALIGAVIVPLLGMRRSLLLFGVVQATSTASFAWLATHAAAMAPTHPGVIALGGAVVVEYLGIGLVTAGFVAFLMSMCTPRFSATQYALLTAVMTLGVSLAGTVSGRVYQQLLAWSDGDATLAWSRFFLLCVATGVFGLVLVPLVTRSRAAELARDAAGS